MKIDNLTNAEMQAIIQTLVNMIDIGIHVVNKDGKTIIYNKKMADIEEMDASNVHGKNILELFKFNNETESTSFQLYEVKLQRSQNKRILPTMVKK